MGIFYCIHSAVKRRRILQSGLGKQKSFLFPYIQRSSQVSRAEDFVKSRLMPPKSDNTESIVLNFVNEVK
ncbi:hypothetical protein V2J09_012829 [Rumex salicifolius]